MELKSDKVDVYTKIEMVKGLLSNTIGNMTDREIRSTVGHCWWYSLNVFLRSFIN